MQAVAVASNRPWCIQALENSFPLTPPDWGFNETAIKSNRFYNNVFMRRGLFQMALLGRVIPYNPNLQERLLRGISFKVSLFTVLKVVIFPYNPFNPSGRRCVDQARAPAHRTISVRCVTERKMDQNSPVLDALWLNSHTSTGNRSAGQGLTTFCACKACGCSDSHGRAGRGL